MPELPEVESARAVIERAALRRRIADVDDTDTYECRPHRPGEIASAGQMVAEHPGWVRFAITFADGGSLRLADPRRLGRARLDPDVDALGPDAAQVGREEFCSRVGRGRTAVEAQLLDQSVIAGVGLLADQTLWQAGIDPRRRVDTLDEADLDHLRVVLRSATRSAISRGGVHTGEVVAHRREGEHRPRCSAPMQRGTVGGRTTWWCPREQR